jgi:uncharacterized protein (DUF2235 family)
MKTIVICSGGTGKDNDLNDPTTWSNVTRIFRCVKQVDNQQVAYLQSGLGTEDLHWAPIAPYLSITVPLPVTTAIKNIAQKAVGVGIYDKIKKAYLWLSGQHEPGDKFILIGFSRGAFVVRCLASLISDTGIIRTATSSLLDDTFDKWIIERTRGLSLIHLHDYAEHEVYRNVPIEALAVWDTVSEVNWGTAFEWVKNTPSSAVKHAIQALALNETREHFRLEI